MNKDHGAEAGRLLAQADEALARNDTKTAARIATVATAHALLVLACQARAQDLADYAPEGDDEESQSSLDVLCETLANAPSDGVNPKTLVQETGGSRSWVHQKLSDLASRDLVERVGYGRYRATDAVTADVLRDAVEDCLIMRRQEAQVTRPLSDRELVDRLRELVTHGR